MSLVENIKSLCAGIGISIPKLEVILGLSRGSVYNWDKNSPSVDRIQKVAEYFGVSTDYLLYGFNKSEFTSLINLVRYKRSIKEFAEDTGIDEFYLNRLCSGVEYKQPSIDTVLRIAAHNENDWLVSTESLFKAAGYNPEEISEDILEDIPLELLRHYQKQGMSEIEMAVAYTKFRRAEFKDAMLESGNYEPVTIAAHHDGEDWTEKELKEIEQFKEFIRSKRQNK